MPVPEHYLFVMGGPLYSSEEWSCGIRFVPNAFSEPEDAQVEAWLGQAVTLASTFISNSAAGFSDAVQLGYVKMNAIRPDGRYKNQTKTFRRDLSGTLPKGGSVAKVAPQISLAATLVTSAARGPASKGRIFLPCPIRVPEADGLLSAANATAYATQVATLITGLNNAPGLDLAVGGLDASVVSGVGAGAQRKVTGVRVGRVLDTQRRRRRSLPESPAPVVPVT